MSWQEELRKLDEELAAGQISADDYRVRRDQVLSSAVSSGSAAAPPAPPKSEATQFIQQPAFTPPPQPPPPSGPSGSADKTQVVGSGQSDADKTQIVSDQGQGWHTARPGADSEKTQVVPGIPGVPPQAVSGGFPRPAPDPNAGGFPPPPGYSPQGWQQQEDLSPPWAGSTFPPLASTGSPDWARQGPEVFEDGSSSGSGKRILLIVLVVLVLGGIGAGIFFVINNNKDDGNQTQQNPQTGQQQPNSEPSKPTTTTKPRPTDPNVALLEDMPKPPASQQQDGKVLDVAQLAEQKLMDPPEVALLTAAGVKQVPWRSAVRKSPEDGPTPDALSAIVIQTGGVAEANKLVEDLRAYQRTVGFIHITEPLPNMPPTVFFEKKVVAEVAVYRGLYVSGKNVIRITTIQTPLTNEASLSGSYRNHTEAMLRTFPAE